MSKKKLAKLLEIKSTYLREYMVRALARAGSGHTGGSSSCLDILNALYNGGIVRHDPGNPDWPGRDRVIVCGHKAPALSVILAEADYLGKNGLKLYLNTYRKFGSSFQGHLSRKHLPGVEVSTGSLGQTISIGCGMAYGLKLKEENSRRLGTVPKVFVLVGDGELQEGQNWEALMSAAKYKLDNLCVIVDRNKMQIDGTTEQIMPIEPLKDKFKAFGWRVKEVKVHSKNKINYLGLLKSFEKFLGTVPKSTKMSLRRSNPLIGPLAVIAHTVKAFGIPKMAGKVDSHGVAPSEEIAKQAIESLRKKRVKLERKYKKVYQKYIWISGAGRTRPLRREHPAPKIKIDLKAPEFAKFVPGQLAATRDAYGAILQYLARQKKIDLIVLEADLAKSTRGDWLDKVKDFDSSRHIELGIAEENMVGWTAGLSTVKPATKRRESPAPKRRIVLASTFGFLLTGRCYDQLRNTVAYSQLNCNFIGSHEGLLVGEDGASHQSLEDIALARVIPGMRLFSASDAVAAVKAIETAINYDGPAYVRLARPKTEIFYNKEKALDPYKAQVFNLTGRIRTNCTGATGTERDKASIIATGPILAEVLQAQKLLAKKGIKVRVYDFICLKPVDEKAIQKAASIGPIVTIEDHSVIAGLGELVAGVVGESKKPVRVIKLGVQDKFGQTGKPDQLLTAYGMKAGDIIKKVCSILKEYFLIKI